MKRPGHKPLYEQGYLISSFQSLELLLCLFKSPAKPTISSFALGECFVEIEAKVEFLLKSHGL